LARDKFLVRSVEIFERTALLLEPCLDLLFELLGCERIYRWEALHLRPAESEAALLLRSSEEFTQPRDLSLDLGCSALQPISELRDALWLGRARTGEPRDQRRAAQMSISGDEGPRQSALLDHLTYHSRDLLRLGQAAPLNNHIR